MFHFDIPTLEEFSILAQIKGDACVSLYLPTSPLGTSAELNRMAFRDLAKEGRAGRAACAQHRSKGPRCAEGRATGAGAAGRHSPL